MSHPYDGPPAYPQLPQRPVGTNGFAIASLCLGILPVCVGLPAVVFGIIALSQIRKTGQKGKGLAIAGLCAVGFWWIGGIIAAVIGVATDANRDASGQITGAGDLSVNSLRVGDCVKELKENNAVYDVPAVPCTVPHAGEVVGEFELSGPGSAYPGEEAITAEASSRCEEMLLAYTRHAEEVDNIYFLYPRQSDWTRGAREITCIAHFTVPQAGSLRG